MANTDMAELFERQLLMPTNLMEYEKVCSSEHCNQKSRTTFKSLTLIFFMLLNSGGPCLLLSVWLMSKVPHYKVFLSDDF